MIPQEALAQLPAKWRDDILAARERHRQEFAERFPKGPPLGAMERSFNRTLVDLHLAGRFMQDAERLSGRDSEAYRHRLRDFESARVNARAWGSRCEKLLDRPLTDREWLEGIEDVYAPKP